MEKQSHMDMKGNQSKPRAEAVLEDDQQLCISRFKRKLEIRQQRRVAHSGGSYEHSVVTHFHFDVSARMTGATYSPDYEVLNHLFQDEWNPTGIRLLGFVHSHPGHFNRPSHGDMTYARDILNAIEDLEELFLPIVSTVPDTGSFQLEAYTAQRDGNNVRIEPLTLEVVDGSAWGAADETATVTATSVAQAPKVPDTDPPQNLQTTVQPIRQVSSEEVAPAPGSPIGNVGTFERVRGAYDLPQLERSRVICVGVGGAASFVENLARAGGVGEYVLIDPDIIEEKNLATQQTYRRDIGVPKVAALADRIRDINPNAAVLLCPRSLDDIDDIEFHTILTQKLASNLPQVTLLCGFTDNFYAQARVNRLALHFGLPSICAQVYREGRGAEISFTYPGVTAACHRCVLRSRYAAYSSGFQNSVTSDGTPIFATERLNALKGFITMAILHHGSDHPRWGRLLERIGNRNLIQIRMDPDLDLLVFQKVLGQAKPVDNRLRWPWARDSASTEGPEWAAERILFDEVVWLPQLPDNPKYGVPACPDCGGSGDLRRAKGTFDTMKMRE